MKDSLIECKKCGSTACYEQNISEDVSTKLCMTCGFTTSTYMKKGSKVVTDAIEGSPELYKDLEFVDDTNQVWLPATISIPEKGMVFIDGTTKDNWGWAAVKAVPILKEEVANFPKGQKFKMDITGLKHFEKKEFISAMVEIGMFS